MGTMKTTKLFIALAFIGIIWGMVLFLTGYNGGTELQLFGGWVVIVANTFSLGFNIATLLTQLETRKVKGVQ